MNLRVLLLAESCNPEWPSVPLVGYNFARALSERDDLKITLVSHVRNRAALERNPIARRAKLHFIDNEWLAKPLYKLTTWLRGGEKLAWTLNTAMTWPAYIAFERQVWKEFRSALTAGEFDFIHRLTPLSPTIPSPLVKRTSVPMILGPFNGGLPWPREYPELISQEREWLTKMRPAYKKLPYYRATFKRAAAVIAGSKHTATEFPPGDGLRLYMPENGIDPDRFPLADGWTPPNGRFRFVTIGRTVSYKGLSLTLEAIAGSARLRECELLVIGDGPERAKHEAFVAEQKLGDVVKFAGWCDQSQLAEQMRASQAFVFPSLREFGGGAVLEAMACGLPSVIVDYGGPAELATPECGVLLPMKPRADMILQLRDAMERLAGNAELCRSMSAAGIDIVRREFTWSAKAKQMVSFYRQVLTHLARR